MTEIDLDALSAAARKAIGTGDNVPYMPISPSTVLALVERVKQAEQADAGWKQLHDTNELCIQNQHAAIVALRSRLAEAEAQLSDAKAMSASLLEEVKEVEAERDRALRRNRAPGLGTRTSCALASVARRFRRAQPRDAAGAQDDGREHPLYA